MVYSSRSVRGKSKTISRRNKEPHTHGIGKSHRVYRTSSAKLQRKRMVDRHH